MDKCFLSAGGTRPPTAKAGAILPSVIMDEFCAFAEKFKLPLMEAGYNALRIATEPDFSANALLFVMLDHVPERVQSPRQWARFKVLYARPMTYDDLADTYGRANVQQFIDQFKMLRGIQSRAADYVASVTVMLSAYCNVVSPPVPLQYPVPIQVTPAYMRAVTLTDAWEAKLTDIVERICSRQPTGRG